MRVSVCVGASQSRSLRSRVACAWACARARAKGGNCQEGLDSFER